MKDMVRELFQFSNLRALSFLIASGDRLVGFRPSSGANMNPAKKFKIIPIRFSQFAFTDFITRHKPANY
jgi:hypothetical protein